MTAGEDRSRGAIGAAWPRLVRHRRRGLRPADPGDAVRLAVRVGVLGCLDAARSLVGRRGTARGRGRCLTVSLCPYDVAARTEADTTAERLDVAEALAGLPDRDRLLVEAYFGVGAGAAERPLVLRDAARRVGVCDGHASRLLPRALDGLRAELRGGYGARDAAG